MVLSKHIRISQQRLLLTAKKAIKDSNCFVLIYAQRLSSKNAYLIKCIVLGPLSLDYCPPFLRLPQQLRKYMKTQNSNLSVPQVVGF